MENRSYQPYSKSRKPSQLKDYRPISILPILCKIYEILKQMIKFIEKRFIYHKHQSGYRKNHSTSTLLMKLDDDNKTRVKLTSPFNADYSKVFNAIDLYTLIQKMH